MANPKVEYCRFANCSQFIITDEDGWDPPDFLQIRDIVSFDSCERLIQGWLRELGDPRLGTTAAARLSETRSWLKRLATLLRAKAGELRRLSFRTSPLEGRLTLTFQLDGLQVRGDARTISTPRPVATTGEQAAIAALLQDAAQRAEDLVNLSGGHTTPGRIR